MVYSEAWGKLIHEKTWSRKSPGTVSLLSVDIGSTVVYPMVYWGRIVSRPYKGNGYIIKLYAVLPWAEEAGGVIGIG